jgi:uncharacterized phage protein gp47/JayE
MVYSNPDYAKYIDMTLYDKNASDIKAAALATLQSRMTDYIPAETNIEVMLIEAMAIEISEGIFTINRLPQVMMESLLSLYGVSRDPGKRATVTVQFTMLDNAGYVVPAGTQMAYLVSDDETVMFTTDTELTIPSPSTTGPVTATASIYSSSVNGITPGTELILASPIDSVVSIEVSVTSSGGVEPETIEDWLIRGTQRLQRLSDALVLPSHYAASALEHAYVKRTSVVDNFNAPSGTPGSDAGHLSLFVYGDGAELTAPQKEELLSILQANAVANIIIHIEDATVVTEAVNVTVVKEADADETATHDAVVSAINDYLNTATWDWSGTLRRNSLIAVIASADGVAYVDTLTTPASDVSLGTTGMVLAEAGTVTVTVV